MLDYRHRETTVTVGRRQLQFVTANGLFSRAALDGGTRMLLDSLTRKPPRGAGRELPAAILDIGCGWGALAVALAAHYDGARVEALDRDLLAVRTTQHNAAANGVAERVAVSQSLLPRVAGAPVDWIVCNVPAKLGENGIRQLVFGAGEGLAEGGLIALVFVPPLAPLMQQLLDELASAIEVVREFEKVRAEHVVWHLRLPAGLPPLGMPDDLPLMPGATLPPGDELWPFVRVDVAEPIDGEPHVAVHNVAEFDTLDHRTTLVAKVLAATFAPPAAGGERILCFNPRHGMLARRLIRERRPASVTVVDRDLLALRATERNLRGVTGVEFAFVSGLALGAADGGVTGPFDVIAGAFDDDEGRGGMRRLLLESAQLLVADHPIVLGLHSAELTTLLKPAADGLGFRFGRAQKQRGLLAQLLRPPRGTTPAP